MAIQPGQPRRDLEKLGYLCRWTLLAAAASVVLATAWAGSSGTMTISSNLKTDVLLTDAVLRQDAPHPIITGFLDHTMSSAHTPQMMFQDHTGTLRFTYSTKENGKRLFAVHPVTPPGAHKIRIKGLPYGPMAFVERDASLTIVPRQMPVYVLDARFLAETERNNKQAAIRIAIELSDLGQLVLVLPPKRELLKKLPEDLARYADIPRVFSLHRDRGGPLSVIKTIARSVKTRLKTGGSPAPKPYVITSDLQLAIAAAELEHFTHLVASKNLPSELPELIRLHAGPDELADHLADESPPHLPIP
jgi:hypothetical protein